MNSNKMTNSEYFEKSKISFAKVMKIFNTQKAEGGYKSFDKFLASKHYEPRFKAGDIIVLQMNNITRITWKHNVVFEIIEVVPGDVPAYKLKHLTPSGDYKIGCINYAFGKYIDKHCVLY